MKKKIAYLVSQNYDAVLEKAKIFKDEHAILRPIFLALGFECEKVDWLRPGIQWQEYATVIPKAVWNYFDEIPAFQAFLEKMAAQSVPMQNPLESVRWNMNKRYLLDTIAQGKPTIPLTHIKQGSAVDPGWFSSFSTTELLAKPAVSGGSKNTFRFSTKTWREHITTFNEILKETDLVLQPFVPEVQTEGEYSFFYFGGEFSHAIVKKPHAGDFRAHSFFGADLQTYSPSEKEIKEAYDFVSCAPTPCVYARVDAIRIKGILHLVELELIEPYLYLEFTDVDKAARRFASAIVRALS